MAKPRLVVLDTPHETDVSSAIGARLAAKLGNGGDGRALCLDARPWDNESPDPTIWDRFYLEARKALAHGQDVVLVGNVTGVPGLQYVRKLAEASGAQMFGRRLAMTIPDNAKDGSEQDHPFDWQSYSVVGDGGEEARTLQRDVNRQCPLSPGTLGREDYPIRLHLLEVPDADRRTPLTAALTEALEDSVVIDTSDLVRRIEATEEIEMLPSKFQSDRVMERLLEQLEDKVTSGLRDGAEVVLAGRDVDDPRVLDMLVHVLGVTETQADLTRVVDDVDEANRIAPPNMRNVGWPPSGETEERALVLGRSLAAQWQPPSLEDLLKLPIADRRRPARLAPQLPTF